MLELNITLLPLHTVVVAVDIEIVGVTVAPTNKVRLLLVAVAFVWQKLLAVITQVITSLLATSAVVKISVVANKGPPRTSAGPF